MISVKQLKEKFEERLNAKAVALGMADFKFILHADMGDFQKAYRKYNSMEYYINGIYELISSDVQNLDNTIKYSTISSSTNIAFRLTDDAESDTEKVENIRKIIDSVCQDNITEEITDSENDTFYVTTFASLASSGELGELPVLGNSFSFQISLSYLLVQNGVNTNDVEYYIDGFKIPFQAVTAVGTPTLDSYVYANTKDGRAKSRMLQSVWGLTFELPAIQDSIIYNKIWNFLNERDHFNEISILEIYDKRNDKTTYKLVMISGATATGVPFKNIGMTFSLTEAIDDYYSVVLSDSLKAYRALLTDEYDYNEAGYNFTQGEFITRYVRVRPNDIIATTADLSGNSNYELIG